MNGQVRCWAEPVMMIRVTVAWPLLPSESRALSMHSRNLGIVQIPRVRSVSRCHRTYIERLQTSVKRRLKGTLVRRWKGPASSLAACTWLLSHFHGCQTTWIVHFSLDASFCCRLYPYLSSTSLRLETRQRVQRREAVCWKDVAALEKC